MNGALPEDEKIKLDNIITDQMLQKVEERKNATVQVETGPKKSVVYSVESNHHTRQERTIV